MSVCIFTGPTLSAENARAELDATYLPPVSQGDVYRAALAGPQAIGIIDGYFESVPAVWHKEILWAMSRGIHVFGSASMGALRAAELAPFGMVGVGAIFEDFRDGRLEDDDEVAILHGPAESSFLALSEAMVNIRATLASAEAAHVIAVDTRVAVERIAKDLYYPDRSYANILERAAEQGVPALQLKSLAAWLPSGRVNQKRNDAVAMLRTMREFLATSPPPKKVAFSFEETDFWDDARRLADQTPPGAEAGADALVLGELRLDPGGNCRAWQQAMLRHLALEESSRRESSAVPAEAVLQISDEFCRSRGVLQPHDAERWLAEHHISREQFLRLMQEEAQLRWVELAEKREIEAKLVDCLRLSGEYRRLLERAHYRQRQSQDPTTTDVADRGPTLADKATDRAVVGRSHASSRKSAATDEARLRPTPYNRSATKR